MAVTYGFYNSLNKDRVYNAEQMSSIFNGIITDGVFASIGGSLMPIAGTGMQVVVKTGKCWFNSTWTLNDALLPLDISAADVSLTRIDAVVVEINSAVSTRANTIKVIKGVPSANPAKPTLANTETLHQYALGYVTVGAGATSITADKIEVNVGKTTCPFITSVLQQTDITTLFNQWDAEFSAWFTNIQAQLSGNVAANLQRQIDANRNLINENYEKTLRPYTKGLLSIPVDSAPDDAFLALLIGVGTYGYRVKVQLVDGTPVEGATVSGITALTGSTLVSGADGIVLGKSTSKTVTISCTSPYIDQAAPASQSVTATSTITDVTLTLTAITSIITVTSSKTAKVSPMAKTMDVTAVGGGGGGGGNYYRGNNQDYAGGGGGGGYVTTEVDIPAADTIKIAVGSGGAKGRSSTNISNEISTAAAKGGNGGRTTVTIGKTTVQASGGTGGSQGTSTDTCILGGAGNGTGGKGAIGVSSTTTVATSGTVATSYIFNNSSFGRAGGGGGGGGGGYDPYSPRGNGGAPNGGRGNSSDNDGTAGLAPGGGGGGGGGNLRGHDGFAGGNGGVYIRFHF